MTSFWGSFFRFDDVRLRLLELRLHVVDLLDVVRRDAPVVVVDVVRVLLDLVQAVHDALDEVVLLLLVRPRRHEGLHGAGRGSPSRRGGVVAESTVRLVVRKSISTRMWEKVRGHGVELKLDPGSRAG